MQTRVWHDPLYKHVLMCSVCVTVDESICEYITHVCKYISISKWACLYVCVCGGGEVFTMYELWYASDLQLVWHKNF